MTRFCLYSLLALVLRQPVFGPRGVVRGCFVYFVLGPLRPRLRRGQRLVDNISWGRIGWGGALFLDSHTMPTT